MATSRKTAKKKSATSQATVIDTRVITDQDRHDLSHYVSHIAHMLSEQGPMSITFVHNNTLLGLQDMHFEKAIEKAESFLGGRGFLENSAYREYYSNGRITDADIDSGLAARSNLKLNKKLFKTELGNLTSGQIYHLNMVHGFDAVTPEKLKDMISDSDATRKLQASKRLQARLILCSALSWMQPHRSLIPLRRK